MKTHTAAPRIIIYCTEPTGLPPVAPSLDGQLNTLGLGECGRSTQDGMGHCMQTGNIIARRPTPDYRPLQGWTRGSRPNGQRGPAAEGGSELCNVSEEAVISVHPSLGMGTRSHSLTRHKAGCVCERGGGPREGFWWGAGHDLFISINRSLTWPLDILIHQIHKCETHTQANVQVTRHGAKFWLCVQLEKLNIVKFSSGKDVVTIWD